MKPYVGCTYTLTEKLALLQPHSLLLCTSTVSEGIKILEMHVVIGLCRFAENYFFILCTEAQACH